MPPQSSRPAFSGLLVHHDEHFDFSVLVPVGWQRLDLSGSNAGVFYAPDESDLLTGIAIEARELETSVQASDLNTLRRGMLSGLRELPLCQIERADAESVASLLTLEARFTFAEGDETRKRWLRLLYQGRTQLRLIAQASSVDLFEFWEPMFFEAMRTIHFGRGF